MAGHARPQIAEPLTDREGVHMEIADYSENTEPQRRTLEEVNAEIDALDKQLDELSRRKSQLTLEHDEIAEAASPVPLFF